MRKPIFGYRYSTAELKKQARQVRKGHFSREIRAAAFSLMDKVQLRVSSILLLIRLYLE
jgi:hypothetical protein